MATQGLSTKPQNEGKDRGTGNIITGETLENGRSALHILDKSVTSQVGTDVIDSISGNVITAASHAARAGDIIRMTSGAAIRSEYRVFSVATNTITLEQDNLSPSPAGTDTFAILAPTSLTVGSDGTITVASAPIEFIRNSVDTQVLEDTATPANNRPLPVKLTDFSGDMILNASNLNLEVQTSHVGANADSMRIGDGTETANVSASNELQVRDDDANTDLDTIAGDTTSLDAKQPALGAAVIAASSPVNIASDQTVPISAASLPLPTGAATEATLVTIDADTSTIAGAVSGTEMQVDVVAALPAGANSIGAVTQATHDNFNANANIQVGDADNSGTNPVFTDRLDVVDVLDTPLLDATTLNGSGGALVDVVASLASAAKKVQLISTAGVFIGLYDDTVLVAQFGPGSDDEVEVSIAASSVIALRSLETAAPAGGSIVVNFMG